MSPPASTGLCLWSRRRNVPCFECVCVLIVYFKHFNASNCVERHGTNSNVDEIPLAVGERDAGIGPDARGSEGVEEVEGHRSTSRPDSKGRAAMAYSERGAHSRDGYG